MKSILNKITWIVITPFVSCSERVIDVDLTSHQDQKLVVNGSISSLNEIQEITCSLSSAFGDTAVTAIENATVRVYTDEGIYSFSHVANGVFESDVPFAGIPGQVYLIEIIYDGFAYQRTTTMPAPVTINGFSVYNNYTYVTLQYLQLDIASEADQYFFYNAWKWNADVGTEDSVWQNVTTPVYWVAPLVAAPAQTKSLYAPGDYRRFYEGDSLRIDVFAISSDIAVYLISLRTYLEKELPNSQFHNPPYFFDGGAYGLTYGYCADTIYFRL